MLLDKRRSQVHWRLIMLNAVECLAKAAEMDAFALRCAGPAYRAAFTDLARTWRHNALMARQQEAWEALQPLDPDAT